MTCRSRQSRRIWLRPAHTLLISLDGALRYIPTALHDGQIYLVERYALSLHTAAGGQSIEQPRTSWQLAGFGVTRAIGNYSALPGVGNELRGSSAPKASPARPFSIRNLLPKRSETH